MHKGCMFMVNGCGAIKEEETCTHTVDNPCKSGDYM